MSRNILLWKVITIIILVGLLIGGGYAVYKIGLSQGLAEAGGQSILGISTFSLELSSVISVFLLVVLFIFLLRIMGRFIFFLIWLFSPTAWKTPEGSSYFQGYRMRPHYYRHHGRCWRFPYEPYPESKKSSERSTQSE